MHTYTVAIVGRPNVGKSTLFNALVNKRVAITHATKGVTHEGVTHTLPCHAMNVMLKDTGGITEDGIFAELISKRSKDAMQLADVILFIVSVEELTAEDLEIATMLRKFQKNVIVVVNKVDNEKRAWQAHEVHSLGLGEPLCVSALHRKNLDTLLQKISTSLPANNSVCDDIEKNSTSTMTKNDAVKLLVLGKPNTGKSSLINTITGSSYMVSKIPGTTRDIAQALCIYNNNPYVFIDSAGIRRKTKIEADVEYYSIHRAIESIARSDVVVLLIDVLEGFSEQDKKLLSLVVRRGKAVIIALNKWDLLHVTKNRLQAERDRLSFLFPQIHYAPVIPVSAKTNYGIPHLMDNALRLYKQLYMKINTTILNKDSKQWVDAKEPPLIRGRRGKIKYIHQVDITPPTFKIRVNNTKLFPEFYRLYIKNSIRKQYSFTEIPFHVLFVT